ncbi:MAG: histidine phosphatase [Deltaproteobacteria bacterium]|nr:MAG: histidine phosphatase [Deltaproteobacteria bacterium]
MRIYLVRHAESVERAGEMPDAYRHLSARGRVSFRETARKAGEEAIRPARIFTSPYVRAVQTAEILAERIGYEGEVAAVAQLGPGFDLGKLRVILDTAPDDAELAMVGHEPDLGAVLTQLLSLPRPYAMRKGAMAAIDLPGSGNRPGARLAWLLEGERKISDATGLLR